MNVRALIMAGCILTLGLASCGGPKDETPATTDSTVANDTMALPPADTTAKPTAADTATSPVLDSAMKKTDTATLLTDSAIQSSKKPEAKKSSSSTSSKSSSTKESSNNNTVGNSTSPTSAEGRRGSTSTGTGETQSGRRR